MYIRNSILSVLFSLALTDLALTLPVHAEQVLPNPSAEFAFNNDGRSHCILDLTQTTDGKVYFLDGVADALPNEQDEFQRLRDLLLVSYEGAIKTETWVGRIERPSLMKRPMRIVTGEKGAVFVLVCLHDGDEQYELYKVERGQQPKLVATIKDIFINESTRAVSDSKIYVAASWSSNNQARIWEIDVESGQVEKIVIEHDGIESFYTSLALSDRILLAHGITETSKDPQNPAPKYIIDKIGLNGKKLASIEFPGFSFVRSPFIIINKDLLAVLYTSMGPKPKSRLRFVRISNLSVVSDTELPYSYDVSNPPAIARGSGQDTVWLALPDHPAGLKRNYTICCFNEKGETLGAWQFADSTNSALVRIILNKTSLLIAWSGNSTGPLAPSWNSHIREYELNSFSLK